MTAQPLRNTTAATRTLPPTRLPQPETHTILEVPYASADRELACGCIPEYGHGPACLDRKGSA